MTHCYIAGPMTGLPDFNADGFTTGCEWVCARGWTPISPHDQDPTHDGPCPPGERYVTRHGSHPYGCYLRASLTALLTCQAVLMLPGWRQSRGAALERQIAEVCGMDIYEQE